MRKTTLLSAGIAFLAALSPALSDEGLWLFTHPPRQQLHEKYAFQLKDALLERLQKASVMVGQCGSGSFISADGLVLTNHHVGLNWLQQLSETGTDLVRDGFYAGQRDKELRCAGLELRVVWSMQDVSARVHDAVKPDMQFAQASKARAAILRAIAEESRLKTGLVSEAVALNHGGQYHLYRYKKYTDVRLVFAPEESMSSLVDACFFRAYENGAPARITHHIAWSSTPPVTGDLVMISGYPGYTDRSRTSADLEARYGPLYYLRFKMISRLNNRLAVFAVDRPEHERRARSEAFVMDNEVGRVLSELDALEKILGRARAREYADEALLVQQDPETAKRRQEALDCIARCVRDGAELSQAHFFLEAGRAFPTNLFGYARALLRLADESAKPDGERLLEYSGDKRQDLMRILVEPKTTVKEMEIGKLAESLDLWARYAGADAELAAKVMDGKKPQERARALIEGTQLDKVEVRQALMQGGRKAVAESQDPMLALARLVDARSRAVRQLLEENISEPCRQAYAVLTRIQQTSRGSEFYPDASRTSRLSFGEVQPYGRPKIGPAPRAAIASLADLFRRLQESQREGILPKSWQAARTELDGAVPILFNCSADGVPGSSGSPIVDRHGRLVGVVARGSAVQPLDYDNDYSGCGAVAARGIIELLDKVYHAAELVKELGGNGDPSAIIAKKQHEASSMPLPPPLQPYPASPDWAAPTTTGFSPESSNPGNSQTGPPICLSPFASTRPGSTPGMPDPPPPALGGEKTPRLGKRHKELVPALIEALKDADVEVQEAAALGLKNLGGDAVAALIEALQAKDKKLRARAGSVLGKLGSDGQNAIPALIRALDDEDVEVRRQAARALAAVVRDGRQASEAASRAAQ